MTEAERERLILEHLPQVRLIARKIHERLPGSANYEDLMSAGTLGLIAAIDNFDPRQNVKLKTYAEFRIRGRFWIASGNWTGHRGRSANRQGN
jgi:RNA polymerase sigma factor for flagellar operon FliA